MGQVRTSIAFVTFVREWISRLTDAPVGEKSEVNAFLRQKEQECAPKIRNKEFGGLEFWTPGFLPLPNFPNFLKVALRLNRFSSLCGRENIYSSTQWQSMAANCWLRFRALTLGNHSRGSSRSRMTCPVIRKTHLRHRVCNKTGPSTAGMASFRYVCCDLTPPNAPLNEGDHDKRYVRGGKHAHDNEASFYLYRINISFLLCALQ